MKPNQLILLCLLCVFIISCTNKRERIGNEIVTKLKEYELKNGCFPEHLTDIGYSETEQGPIYYTKKGCHICTVYYAGRSLGQSVVYNWKTGKWEPDGG
jgi:hypothetical protein